jgi:hypothetical protein
MHAPQKLLGHAKMNWTSSVRKEIVRLAHCKSPRVMLSNPFSTPPASNRFTSRSLSTYTPPTGGGPFGSEAEPELMQPSPHFLDRSLEALRQKKAKGAQQLAVAVQPRAADVVPVSVPGAPRTALAVAHPHK